MTRPQNLKNSPAHFWNYLLKVLKWAFFFQIFAAFLEYQFFLIIQGGGLCKCLLMPSIFCLLTSHHAKIHSFIEVLTNSPYWFWINPVKLQKISFCMLAKIIMICRNKNLNPTSSFYRSSRFSLHVLKFKKTSCTTRTYWIPHRSKPVFKVVCTYLIMYIIVLHTTLYILC